jgi:ABC-type branched-subunit amino acid transport system substrate-binding protein
MRRFNILSILFLSALLFLTACGGGSYNKNLPAPGVEPATPAGPPNNITPPEGAPASQNLRPVKVGILLPLSGPNQQLGQSMLKAAQMALFDAGYEGFELIPRDTKNTPQEAAAAASAAIADGAELLLGPIFSDSVAAVKPVAKQAHINVIAFSTDWKQAGDNVYTMGFLPFDQIERVVKYASSRNIKRIGVLAPTSDYGQITVSAYQSMAGRAGLRTTDVEHFSPQSGDLGATVRRFSHFDERHPAGQPVNPATSNILPYDAVFMPVGGDAAKTISGMLSQYAMPPGKVRRIGTGLFDDPTLAQEPGLEGAWFAAPSPNARRPFERRFQQSYGTTPPRLATLAYDATALAAILARRGLSSAGNAPGFDRASLLNPNGFAGIDGIFRFRPDGTAERGLAILEIRRTGAAVIQEAPNTFQAIATQ